MALLDAKEFQFGRQNVFATDTGAADIPTTNTSGVIQLGDLILNLSGTIGAPAFWVCTTAGSSPVFTSGPITGGGTATRTVAGSATLASSDRYLFITAAGTVTLPAPSTALSQHQYDIKATAQPVTISTAAGSLDGVATPGSQTIMSQEDFTCMTDGTNWFTMTRDPEYQISTPTPPATLTVRDRWVVSGAGALTIPAPAGYVRGKPFTIHATGTVTATPASGQISGAAAITLTAGQNATIITDSTNFFVVAD
jgi:hypothetical protein